MRTLISWAPLVPSLCSTLQRSLQIRSLASADSFASSGNFKWVLQFTICIARLDHWLIRIYILEFDSSIVPIKQSKAPTFGATVKSFLPHNLHTCSTQINKKRNKKKNHHSSLPSCKLTLVLQNKKVEILQASRTWLLQETTCQYVSLQNWKDACKNKIK